MTLSRRLFLVSSCRASRYAPRTPASSREESASESFPGHGVCRQSRGEIVRNLKGFVPVGP